MFLETGEVVPPSRVVIIAEPKSSLGSIKAVCTIDLTPIAEGTNLAYDAHAEMEGKIASIAPEFVLKGAVKIAMDKFFKGFEKQVSGVVA